jgi:integrin-linked kinase-associated serine/threonine phosphatase 2C
MGSILAMCRKKDKKNKVDKNKKKEDKKQIFKSEKIGLKKEKEQAGQDTTDVIQFELGNNIKYFAVYDGHGIKGGEASQFARDEIRQALINNKRTVSKFKDRREVEKYFKKLFFSIQQKYKKRSSEFEASGTCAICVLIIDNNCYFINLGDSRAVIGSKQTGQKIAYQMSIDHKPNREDEKKRIENSGGIVTQDKSGGLGPARVYSKTDDGPGLAVARSLGDLLGHSVGVTSEPEVSYKELDHDDRFIVIGSDGIWDVMNSAEIVGLVFEKTGELVKDKIADAVVSECRNRWELINLYKLKLHNEKSQNKDNDKGKANQPFFTIDDISAVVCYLNIDEK